MNIVNVGDSMLIRYSGLGGGSKIHQVEKVYKRYFVCGGKKWKLDGHMRGMGGNKWHRPYIRHATNDDVASIAAAERRHAVSSYEWTTADQKMIDAVHAVIAEQRTASIARAQSADRAAAPTTTDDAGSTAATCSIPHHQPEVKP